jgi:hypothetical protein
MVVGRGTVEGASHARLVGILALVLAALTVAVILVVQRNDAEAGAIPPEVRAALGVFRDARTTGDDLPGGADALERADDLQAGEDIGLSRRVRYEAGDAFVWPMDGGVCHASPAGSGCVPIDQIERRGVSLGVQTRLDLRTRRYDEVRAFGIARDGIQAVRLTLHDGRVVVTPVRDNTFLLPELGDRPAEVSWSDADGEDSIAVPGPSAADLALEIAGP